VFNIHRIGYFVLKLSNNRFFWCFLEATVL
jgi:hypothetical protein